MLWQVSLVCLHKEGLLPHQERETGRTQLPLSVCSSEADSLIMDSEQCSDEKRRKYRMNVYAHKYACLCMTMCLPQLWFPKISSLRNLTTLWCRFWLHSNSECFKNPLLYFFFPVVHSFQSYVIC